jgi:hypothetical protein
MWDGSSAIGYLAGLELHFKETLKNQDERRYRRDNEPLDAAACVDGIKAFTQCVANGAFQTYDARCTYPKGLPVQSN